MRSHCDPRRASLLSLPVTDAALPVILSSGCSPGRPNNRSPKRTSVGDGRHHTAARPKKSGGVQQNRPLGVCEGRKWATVLCDLSHFPCMCLSHYFIFSLWIQTGQQHLRLERGVGNKVADTPRFSAVYLSAVKSVSVSTSHICCAWK